MPQLLEIFLLSLTALIAYLLSISPAANFTPQVIGLFTIIFLVFFRQKKYYLLFLAAISNLLVFATGGLNSPVFFLIYFSLFAIAFQNPPSTTLAYSIILILLLSQSLNSQLSLLPLFSLLFITPLAWFVGHQFLEKIHDETIIATNETDFLFWLNLKFKTGITTIADLSSQLLSSPSLSHSQKESLQKIKSSAHNLLNSAQKLTSDINKTDET